MIVILYIIVGTVALGFLAAYLSKKREEKLRQQLERGEIDKMPEPKEVDDECCGAHEVCERDSLLAAVSTEVEYYDDDELDRFALHDPDSYSDSEIEEFSEVLYSLKGSEVAGWVRSLQLRSVEIPSQLKDEVLLIVGERRNH